MKTLRKGSGKASTARIREFVKKSRAIRAALNKTDKEIYDQNPHLRQVFAEGKVPKVQTLVRTLDDSAPTASYSRRTGLPKTVEHFGQRKLLLSEIEFLTRNYTTGDTVLYAGSAPGDHIPFLTELFPGMKLIMYDPRKYNKVVYKLTDQIYEEYFTDEVAQKLAKEVPEGRMLFVSDIRSDPSDERVLQDMKNQEKWISIMKPKKSLLKFRLPYAPGKVEYLDGDIFLQCFAPQTSTETRLECSWNAPQKEYDNQKYQDQLFYFNTVTRVSYYKHPHRNLGYDHCYDCASEIHILKKYIEKNGGTLKSLKERIDRMLPPIFSTFK